MQHLHRLEIRIVVPRRAPMNIQIDAQDVIPDDAARPSPYQPMQIPPRGIELPG